MRLTMMSAIDVGGHPLAARDRGSILLVSEFDASIALRRDNELLLHRRTVDRHCVDGVPGRMP
jgi:hypothetical protein